MTALLLLHVVVLISMHLAVGTDIHPAIDQHEASLSGDDLRKSLINTYSKCQADRNDRVDFLIELYKGARFYFLLGLTLIIALLVSTFPALPKEDLPSAVAKQLTENATFLERLSERIASIENKPKSPATIPTATPDSSPPKPKSDSAAKPTAEPPTNAAPPTTANPPPHSEPTLPAHEIRKTPDQQEGKSHPPPPTIAPPTLNLLPRPKGDEDAEVMKKQIPSNNCDDKRH